MRTQWGGLEDEALQGLPWSAQLLYLRGLRPWMDFATGMVGERRKISRRGLMETLEVEAGQGRGEAGMPSVKAVRYALDVLARAGLVERRGDDKLLIFFLPLAERDDSVSEKWGRSGAEVGPTKQGREESSDDAGCTEKWGRSGADGSGEKWGLHPVSGIRKDKKTANAVVEFAGEAGVESVPVRRIFDAWRQTMGHPRAKLDGKRRRCIEARLSDGFSVESILLAIDGCKGSAWHQGKNDGHRVFDDIELICRSATKLEQFMAMAAKGQQQDHDLEAWLREDDYIDGECSHVKATI